MYASKIIKGLFKKLEPARTRNLQWIFAIVNRKCLQNVYANLL